VIGGVNNALCWEREIKMTNKNIQSELSKRVNKVLDNLPKQRLKDVAQRRFGLKDGQRETLEAIGQSYGITRERVRQIESDALKILRASHNLAVLKPVFDYLNKIFEKHNHLVAEQRLFDYIIGHPDPHPLRSATVIVLTLGKPYKYYSESEKFHPHWVTKENARKKVEKVVDYLIKHLDEKSETHQPETILNHLSSKFNNLSKNTAINALDVSRYIDNNVFGEVGLTHWPEINPRGMRDKAYLVLKKEGTPHHFTDITELINKANFSSQKAYPQTVHNELIKDERFVLIGRGIYALVEWGYRPGTVRDVIKQILTERGRPLPKKEIISAVLDQRKVKPSTVTINLQNNPEFEQLEDRRYRLK